MKPQDARSKWHETLDAIEASLAATDAALAAGTPPPTPPIQPFPTEALPAELAVRAQSLLARTERLEREATESLERVRVKLQSLPARRPSAVRPRTGRLVDIGA